MRKFFERCLWHTAPWPNGHTALAQMFADPKDWQPSQEDCSCHRWCGNTPSMLMIRGDEVCYTCDHHAPRFGWSLWKKRRVAWHF